MTESTRFLTTAQAAARLGVKPATLYAYVSRGLVKRYPAPDGRSSRFDPSELARLERRPGARRGASPTEIVIGSELLSVAPGRVWYRGLDAVAASRSLRFEEVAWWLWTGRAEGAGPWRASPDSLRAAKRAAAGLGNAPSACLPVIASAVAGLHASRPAGGATAAASDVMACLVDALPGAAPDGRFSARLSAKLGRSVTDADLTLSCERGLTYGALAARLAAGGGVAAAVAAGMSTDVTSPPETLIAQAASWIAHALEEQRRPTPIRPRLAYTGPAPQRSAPRRMLDAVVDYLSE